MAEYKLSYTAEEIDNKLGQIENLANKNEIPSKISELDNDEGFATIDYVDSKMGEVTVTGLPLTGNKTNGTLIINDGTTSGKYAVAGGTTNKNLVSDLVGDAAANLISINKSEANGDMSIAYGADNKAHSSASNAFGIKNQSGFLGYYISSLSTDKKTLTLSTTQEGTTKPTASILSKWKAGWKVTIINDKLYPLCAEIAKNGINTSKGTVTFTEPLPFDKIIIPEKIDIIVAKISREVPHDRTIIAIPPVEPISIGSYTFDAYRPGAIGEVELGFSSTAFGFDNIAAGTLSTTFGYRNDAIGTTAFVTGRENIGGFASLVGGHKNEATGSAASATGAYNIASGDYSQANGFYTKATGKGAHAEGWGNNATDQVNLASGNGSHAEGRVTKATASGAHAEGVFTKSEGEGAHAEGKNTTAIGAQSHAEGFSKIAKEFGNETDINTIINTHTQSADEAKFSCAYGSYSHVEGSNSLALGISAHAEGNRTISDGNYSHAEGRSSRASGMGAHSEGKETIASGENSHTEGNKTQAIGIDSHAEGNSTLAGCKGFYIAAIDPTKNHIYLHTGNNAVIPTWDNPSDSYNTEFNTGYILYTEEELANNSYGNEFSVESNGYYHWPFAGNITEISGNRITYESDVLNKTDKWLSNVIDPTTGEPGADPMIFFIPVQFDKGLTSMGLGSHAEGWNTLAGASHTHSEGYYTVAAGRYGHAEGYGTRAGYAAHAEGHDTLASGLNSHTEGVGTKATDNSAHAEGRMTTASSESAHAEGSETTASGKYSHAEGFRTTASGGRAHAEGHITTAEGHFSHAEGQNTVTTATGAHAEGYNTTAGGDKYATDSNGKYIGVDGKALADQSNESLRVKVGMYSHAEGMNTTASGNYSHTEGANTNATAECSHAEGMGTKASGTYSHAEGHTTVASGSRAHAEGWGTKATGAWQHVDGKWNIEDPEVDTVNKKYGKYVHIVGNGTSNTARSNAHTLDWDGNAWFAGNVQTGNYRVLTNLIKTEPITQGGLYTSKGAWASGNAIQQSYSVVKIPCKPGDTIYVNHNGEKYGKKSVIFCGAGDNHPVANGKLNAGFIYGSAEDVVNTIVVKPEYTNVTHAYIPFETSKKDNCEVYCYSLPINWNPGDNKTVIVDNLTHWNNKKWYAYGTSITQVDNSAKTGKYAPYLASLSGMILTNKGIGSQGIANADLGGYAGDPNDPTDGNQGEVMTALMSDDGKSEADLITIEVGANDFGVVAQGTLGNYYDTGDDTFCGRLNQCLAYLQANTKAQILVIGSPYGKDSNEGAKNKYELYKATEECCRYNGIQYLYPNCNLGPAKLSSGNQIYTANDHTTIHQSELGGYIYATHIWEKLKTMPLFY